MNLKICFKMILKEYVKSIIKMILVPPFILYTNWHSQSTGRTDLLVTDNKPKRYSNFLFDRNFLVKG